VFDHNDHSSWLLSFTDYRQLHLTGQWMHRTEAPLMIKRRAGQAGLPEDICCHTFRATGITNYLENGRTIEKAQPIACHQATRPHAFPGMGPASALDLCQILPAPTSSPGFLPEVPHVSYNLHQPANQILPSFCPER
jgi:hypothetical protein